MFLANGFTTADSSLLLAVTAKDAIVNYKGLKMNRFKGTKAIAPEMARLIVQVVISKSNQ